MTTHGCRGGRAATPASEEDLLKCPYCGSFCADNTLYCPNCKQPLPTQKNTERDRAEAERDEAERRSPWRKALFAAAAVITVAALCVGVYKLVTLVHGYQLTRLYTRGAYAPTINATTMSDMRSGHAVVFYGEDGDQIYLPEMNRSLSISGGIARMEIADSDWFDLSVSDVDYADITLSPTLISETGRKTVLPLVNFQIDVPESPLTVSSPASDRITVVTSTYPLTLNVVPGSTVFVNGEDVTESVDRSGLLNTNVSVEPIGDNIITLIVRTPKHRETRKEIDIFRQHYDIELELDSTVSDKSSARTMAVTGKTEPGAMISVDTDHLEESVTIDMETGRFSFIARFSTIGDNVVRFHASRPGKQDAVISFTVDYLPSLAEYSAKAWAMDYAQLKSMFAQWNGRVFQCKGELIDAVTDGDTTYLIMDVGDSKQQQLVVLENRTSTTSPTLSRRYIAYADVAGQYMYRSEYYPLLIARYMDLAS